jgi:hypothetical protein
MASKYKPSAYIFNTLSLDVEVDVLINPLTLMASKYKPSASVSTPIQLSKRGKKRVTAFRPVLFNGERWKDGRILLFLI